MFLDDATLTLRPARRDRAGGWALVAALLVMSTGFVTGACQEKRPALAVMIPNRSLGPMTIAVAPALNFSGAADFDPAAVADLMASELSYLQSARVIPVSRVLAVLLREGCERIESPEHALRVAAQTGADAILVFAITEYDPYQPPIVGVAAQLYAFRQDAAVGGVGPVSGNADARPFAVSAGDPAVRPIAQAQRVFDASHDTVVAEVKRFAARREAGDGPWGWKRHLASQRHYLRYCCYATLADLMGDHELSTVETVSLR